MKRIKTAAYILGLLMAAGCAPAAVAEPQPEPTPAPVKMAVISAEEEFSGAVERRTEELAVEKPEEQPELQIQVVLSAADNAVDADFDVALMYMPEQAELDAISGGGVVLTDHADNIPENLSAVTVDNAAAVAAAWEALYTYPTHSTPIRLLTLTEGGASLSREIYETMLAEGKLQDKGSYIGSHTDQDPGEWVAERLAEIPVGLLDTIYAETEELAAAAYNALRAAERNDSVEVICPVLSDALIGLMVEDHWSMGVCVGVTMGAEVNAMLELAEDLVATGETKTVALEPLVVYSHEVKALVDSGISDIAAIMDSLAG